MERRLAAVLFSDVVGYSDRMSKDEAQTHELLKQIETDLIVPKAEQYNVRFIRLIGDGQLMEFPSVVAAVTYAIEFQLHIQKWNEDRPAEERFRFRIGINIGDVMVEAEDIYGDGVNVAARLESLAEPGGICLSRSAYEQIHDKLDLDVRELGPVELKNIPRPVDTFAVELNEKVEALLTPIATGNTTTKGIILIFHGPKFRSDWQNMVPELLRSGGRFDTRVLGYSFADTLQFIAPGLTPKSYCKKVVQALFMARRDFPEQKSRLYVLADGFATDAVMQVLKDNPQLSIDKLMLCGSVLNANFDWSQVETQIKGSVVNECATHDSGPLVANALNWHYGKTGVYGFDSPKVINRFHVEKRSGLLDPSFIKQYWVSFFDGNAIVRSEVSPGAQHFPGHFAWLGASLRTLLAGVAALMLVSVIGAVQFLNSDFKLNSDNVVCKCLRAVYPVPKDVAIGFVSQYSKDSGALSKWAVQRAISQAKERGELSFNPTVVARSSEGDKATLLKALEDFKASTVAGVIGPMGSEMAFYAKRWGNRNHIPAVTANASASSLVKEGDFGYFFRVSMSDEARVGALIEWMLSDQPKAKPYVIHEWTQISSDGDEPALYGMEQASTAIRNLPGSTQQATVIRFTRHNKESMTEAASLVENDPNRPIAIFGYTDNIIHIIRALHARGIQNDIFLTGTYNKKVAEADFPYASKIHIISDVISEEGYSTSIANFKREYDQDPMNPRTDPEIIAAYTAAGKEIERLEFDVVAAYAFDAANIVLDAIHRGVESSCLGTVDGSIVAEQLREADNKRRVIVHSGFLGDRQEMFHTLVRYKIGDDQKLFRFAEASN